MCLFIILLLVIWWWWKVRTLDFLLKVLTVKQIWWKTRLKYFSVNKAKQKMFSILLNSLLFLKLYNGSKRNIQGKVKFIDSEKATKFCEIFTLLLSSVVPVQSKKKPLRTMPVHFCHLLFQLQVVCRKRILHKRFFPLATFSWPTKITEPDSEFGFLIDSASSKFIEEILSS